MLRAILTDDDIVVTGLNIRHLHINLASLEREIVGKGPLYKKNQSHNHGGQRMNDVLMSRCSLV